MSLTLQQAPNIQATSRQPQNQDGAIDSRAVLEVALAQFGANLTDTERKKLHSQKSGLDDADAALKFTLELDDLDPVKRGRTFAIKLCSFLQIIHSFGQVVDTYVSSNPEVAALIWGSVKLTLMILINFTSYFQRFTDLLRGFDQLISQLNVYKKLFSNSKRLKDSIDDFYTAIVICCTRVIELTRIPWQEKAWAALTHSFEGQIRPLVEQIHDTASHAQEEARLAKAQDDQIFQEQQKKQQQSILGLSIMSNIGIRSIMKDTEHQNMVQIWGFLLKRLSSYDFEAAYKSARSKRHKGTSQWIFETQQFQDWQKNEKPAVLYVAGKIGSGKTVLTASVIDRILSNKTQGQAVSLFFIRFDEADSQEAEGAIRSIVRQALNQAPVNKILLELLQSSAEVFFKLDSLLDILSYHVTLLDDFFLILDGLEEFTVTAMCSVLDFFSCLAERCPKSRIKIIISARESIGYAIESSFQLVFRIMVGSSETDCDLRRFTQDILKMKQEKDWAVGNQDLIDDIIECISIGGEGMFLWAYLTIEDICTQRTDEDIRKTLGKIPRELCKTFDRALKRIDKKGNADVAHDIFKWAAGVRSPLTLEQLSEVLKIKSNQSDSKASQRVNGIHHAPAWCENLVCVEDGSGTIHFSHHSIQAYLLGPQQKPSIFFNLNQEACDIHIGEICLTYLNFNDFQRAVIGYQRSRFVPENLPFELVSQTLETVFLKPYTRMLAQRLTNRGENSRTHSNSQLLPLNHVSSPHLVRHYPFLIYAKEYWPRHTAWISSSSIVWKSWQRMDVTAEYAPWTNLEWNPQELSAVGFNPVTYQSIMEMVEDDHTSCKGKEKVYVAMHKALAYAAFLNHQALIDKVTQSFTNLNLLISSQLVERFMRPRILETPLSTNSWDWERDFEYQVDTHNLLIHCVTRYVAQGGETWPSNTRGVQLCQPSCEGRYKTERWMHTRSAKILEEGGDKWISQRTKWIAQFSLMQSDRANFIELLNTFWPFAAEGHIGTMSLEDGDLIHAIIMRGDQWFTIFLKWLESCGPTPWQCDVVACAVGHAVELRSPGSLREILEKDCWAKPEHFGNLQSFSVESIVSMDTDNGVWSPMFHDEPNNHTTRLAEICIPSIRLPRLSRGEEEEYTACLIRNASRLSIQARRWSLATALHACAPAYMVSEGSGEQTLPMGNHLWLYDRFEAFGEPQNPERETAELLEATFSCAESVGFETCRIQNAPYLCSRHRPVGQTIFKYRSNIKSITPAAKCLQFALGQMLSWPSSEFEDLWACDPRRKDGGFERFS